ncbi:pyridoxamine 5'-phosphate oxidase [Polymorphobacter megasporae]|uniref:pyridoxamine 5'-phosphate oxidase n=1 Tax=Glacieibacterium megasporae TaxID=2835787 RepID=UPI001C1DF3D6|nr:pyridoxamine 5'-phosphate oxidase [Polymorphobacter megasporae]UAJ12147.1 pyridoxamine 5'-phosphate oxidase [Polymorphobacter megasporae]
MLHDPFPIFADWFAAATAAEVNDPNAMALATATPDGRPSVRVVLMKAWDERGFVFYTNLDSRKGAEIAANPAVHLDFHWKSLRRQVRVDGRAELVRDAEADAYFDTRPRDSQLGAWASDQSRPLPDRAVFREKLANATAKYDGTAVPRPARWSGFRVVPQQIEFWQDVDFRHHERTLYTRSGDGWTTGMLYP